MGKNAIGIDIGGTGIKCGLIDLKTGDIIGDRVREGTPVGGSPQDIADVILGLVARISKDSTLPTGICFPAVVRHGVTLSAANISKEWLGLNASQLFESALEREVHIVNDADAAGYAEIKFGAGRQRSGVIIMTTLGTGIGTALFINGKLVPNTELGHLEIDGVDYETKASFSAKQRENLSWPEWAGRLEKYYSTLERLFTPDLFIVGGGVSREHAEFLPLLKLKTEILPAVKRNDAGILGAAALAKKQKKDGSAITPGSVPVAR